MYFLAAHRSIHGIPARPLVHTRQAHAFEDDLKSDVRGLETSSYDGANFHVPYGPGYDAARIEKIIHTNDLKLNSPFNPKNKNRRNLHRHLAFCGEISTLCK